MGTSQSSRGPKNGALLIPPWADDTDPITGGDGAQLKGFRTSMGKYVKNGDRNNLKKALGQYSKNATGGGKTASKRMSSVIQAGGNLFELLDSGTITSEENVFTLSDFIGRSCEEVIARISHFLAGNDGDSEKINSAINQALSEAFEGHDNFKADIITDDLIIATLINYLSESIFLQITSDTGQSWNNAETTKQLQDAETDLREVIGVIVDNYMRPKIDKNDYHFSAKEINKIQKEVIVDIWNEWESYL